MQVQQRSLRMRSQQAQIYQSRRRISSSERIYSATALIHHTTPHSTSQANMASSPHSFSRLILESRAEKLIGRFTVQPTVKSEAPNMRRLKSHLPTTAAASSLACAAATDRRAAHETPVTDGLRPLECDSDLTLVHSMCCSTEQNTRE